MPVELKVPSVGESVTEVQVGEWSKREGDWAKRDESLVEIESDKATVDVVAPVSGNITKVLKKTGETVSAGEVIGYMEEAEAPQDKPPKDKKPEEKRPQEEQRKEASEEPAKTTARDDRRDEKQAAEAEPRVMPAARRLLAEHDLDPGQVQATGPGGRLLKEDVQRHVAGEIQESKPQDGAARSEVQPAARQEEVVRMTPIRRRIAQRLVEAQQTAALLTTFNEVDMSAVIALRQQHRDAFQARYGVKLGFMSFFVKAVIDALKQVPQVNAEIRGDDIIYRNYYDIGIAVGGAKGLVVPVLRDADRMSFAEVEVVIGELSARARDNKLKLQELEGGTFTISNGGIYGSLLSTPIVNPPQSGILGMHAIQERPVARDGAVVIRPMMYVALTYDHRIVDGREAVTFLRRVKDVVEDPSRMLIEI